MDQILLISYCKSKKYAYFMPWVEEHFLSIRLMLVHNTNPFRDLFARVRRGLLLGISVLAVAGGSLQAATINKANNTTNLNQTGSWVGESFLVPGMSLFGTAR